jgi:hypothetical protein
MLLLYDAGDDLDTRLRRHGGILSEREARFITAQVPQNVLSLRKNCEPTGFLFAFLGVGGLELSRNTTLANHSLRSQTGKYLLN